jgi:hypothetical protein
VVMSLQKWFTSRFCQSLISRSIRPQNWWTRAARITTQQSNTKKNQLTTNQLHKELWAPKLRMKFKKNFRRRKSTKE